MLAELSVSTARTDELISRNQEQKTSICSDSMWIASQHNHICVLWVVGGTVHVNHVEGSEADLRDNTSQI